jgi:hypothetical protein
MEKIDHECLIFQCLDKTDEYKLIENRFLNLITNSRPSLIHGNGSEKNEWKRIASELIDISK